MKKGNKIVCLCAALFALIITGSLIHTSPALAWDTWPTAANTDTHHAWTVVFDKAMNAATINSQNIYVSNDIQGSSRVGGVNVKASNSTHALVAPPAGGWKSGASYYLIITQKVLTSANRPLKDEVRMPFHIKAITKAVPTIDVINNGSQMTVKVNGTQLSLKQPPYTVSGHPMVPIKEIAQALGAAVDWDAKNKKMTIMGDKVAELTINSKTARVNGAAVTLETPAAVTAGTIMAPLSFLQPALGAKVSYTGATVDADLIITGENGDVWTYTGPVVNGMANGTGTAICIKSDKYDGREVDGITTYEKGDKYTGGFINNQRSGQGTCTGASGTKYVGEWKDDKTNGQGTCTWGSGSQWAGDKYVGEYKDGHRNGQGTYTWPNGDKYVGQWKDSDLNGQGTYTWANGNKYVGEWKDGKRTGQGTYYYADGRVESGIWYEDKLISR